MKNKNKILTYVLIVIGFLVLAYSFTPQVLGGKIVNQSDISGWQGMARESSVWNAAHPEDPALWSNSMFGGMPTISYIPPTKGDLTQQLYDFLLLGRRPATYLFIALLGGFLLMLAFGVHPLIAIGGAVAIAFCSYNFQIIQVGHNTKMQAIAFMPWALAAVVYSYKAKKWPQALLGGTLFALAVSFQVKANHPQISYYLAIIIAIYAIAVFISTLVAKKRVGRFFIISGLLLVFGLVGIGTNATKLIPTWDYTPHSMRGGTTKTADGEARKGLDIDYATAWSYGWEELPNLMIPNYNGGSSAGALGPDSQTVKLLKRSGQPNIREISKNLPLYWGPQPFTAGPMYMGAITVFLFLLGLFCCKGKDRWWLLAATVLAIFLAAGSHFLAFTRFAMKVLPLYNKFRTVSMALVILQVTLPVLGFITLDRIVRGNIPLRDFRRSSWLALALTAGFCILAALIPSIAGSFSGSADAGMQEILTDALRADRRALLVKDAWMSAALILLCWGLLWWGYGFGKVSEDASVRNRKLTAALGVSALVLINLFVVGKRYLNDDHFVTPRSFIGQFDKRPVDKAILADTDPSFRVLDLTVNVFNDSHPSYWHKNIGGYSPAKLQIYQEYIESHLQGEISQIYSSLGKATTLEEAEAMLPKLEGLSKLNCRYIILNGDMAPLRYPYARGNAWFEEDGAADGADGASGGAAGRQSEGSALSGSATGKVSNGAAGRLSGRASGGSAGRESSALGGPDGAGKQIELLSYTPNELRYRYTTPCDAKAVFSEVYYPDGWTLKVVDTGELLPISLSDDVFRSAILPAGEHELVMRFAPDSYARGYRLSLICSLLTLLLAAGAIVYMVTGKKQNLAEEGGAQKAAAESQTPATNEGQKAAVAEKPVTGKKQKED